MDHYRTIDLTCASEGRTSIELAIQFVPGSSRLGEELVSLHCSCSPTCPSVHLSSVALQQLHTAGSGTSSKRLLLLLPVSIVPLCRHSTAPPLLRLFVGLAAGTALLLHLLPFPSGRLKTNSVLLLIMPVNLNKERGGWMSE